MNNRMKMGLIALLGVVIWGFTPGVVHAVNTHDRACNECHRSSANPRSMANLCVNCHLKSGTTENPVARFDVGTASNTLGHNGQAGTDSGAETTHNWGGFSTNWAPAGSTYPPTTFYSSRYSISTKRITCTICHDPHGVTGPNYMVRVEIAGDVLCQQCHSSWFILNDSNDANPVNDTNALLTHPVVTDYVTFAAANSTDYNPTPSNASNGGTGEVRLVDGGVSCTSCHGTHYADSSSATTDGTGTYNDLTMAKGDGNILRADGPLRMTGTPALPGPRNGATGTAQLRSNLCQSCHKIELHGQGVSGDHRIGCLDCHGGHAYNGGVPNAYILNKMTPDAVPTRPDRVNGASVQITFNNYPNGESTRTTWADENVGGTEGFCEKCHGDVNSVDMVLAAEAHGVADTNECDVCHKHNDPADIYSFNRDASAATCGQCHGFPPYLNVRGDQGNDPDGTGPNPPLGTLGGYAWNYVDLPAYDYVNSTTHEKDEDKTGHMVHAGADLPNSPAGADDWYFVGNSGVDNCKVCHGPDAGTTAGNHRINQTNTFRDLPFDGIAKTGGMSPVYKTGAPNIWTCSNVYCHTNGAPYTGASRPARNFSVTNVTPAWDQANGGGFNAIYGNANRCQFCHGNDAISMTSKSNSTVHQAHLGTATTLNMGIVFDCKVCHVNTASSPTALKAGAMDGRQGIGKHVNGSIEVDFETGVTPNTLPEALSDSTYTAATGVCSTYCHNVTGAGGAMAADWDVTTDMQCDSCHGGLATDISGDGGYGSIATDSHSRHILTTGTGPKLACAECHGTGSDAGTHAGHFDGQINMKPPVNGVTFADICQECHGYDAETGEVLPVWGSPATTDCATCHAGIQCGADFNGYSVVTVDYARTSGHNRPTESGVYPQTANPAANVNCSGCHVSDDVGHWDGVNGDYMLRTDAGFPATYAGNENSYCGNCHGAAPAHPTNAASLATRNINTHQSKLCVACHNVHGDQNIQMIWTTQADQVSHDPSVTGKYAADVFFSNGTNFLASNLNSYDEDDGAVGGAGEANSDDICATCHTTAAGTTHNNANNSTGDHYQGSDCFTCHANHTDSSDAFKLGAGTACNDCHGFPPATGAHRKGTLITDPELHSNTSGNLDTEDRSDCAFCHTGADLYTYDLGVDQAQAGPQGNHGVSQSTRRTVLGAAVGYEATNFSCTTACHASNNGDGEWDDVNGLNCNACHYAAASPSSAGNVTANNSEAVSAVHNKHFDKNAMSCAQCHDVSYSAGITAIRGVLTHIIAPDYSGAGNDGTLVQGRANALLDEATVVRSSMTYSGGVADAGGANNTCAGTGFGLGCHASGSADWDVVIPATSAGCVMCHTETNTAAYNPVSGIHDNSPSGPTVTGNAHDGNFDNGSAGIADCVTCHTTSPTAVVANHINGTLNTGTAITLAGAVGYTQATGVCATTCHSAGTVWAYKWATSAYNTNGTECANCHGDYATGWIAGVAPHTEFPTRGNKHNNTGTLTYPCTDCHAIGSVSGYNWTTKWDPTGVTSNHGDDKITLNQTASNTIATDTAPNPDRVGCTTSSCHGNTTGYNFRITTTTFTTQTVSGNLPAVLCSGCHGGTVGTNANGYWPDGVNTAGDNASEDNSGAHLKHMTALASSVMGQSIAQLLTDSVGVGGAPWNTASADTKQKELCTYCHGTTSNPLDATHGLVSYLPADISTMFTMWGKVADNGTYPGSYTCATVDCHFNKTTPTTNDWYDAPGNGTCVMCHVDVTVETAHTKHTSTATATTFGRASQCADCHEAATNWATNTPPASGHLNNTYVIAGTRLTAYTGFTYPTVKGTCGTNACHNSGNGVGAPAVDPTWGTIQTDCTICHAASPTTGAHTIHMAAKVVSYVAACTDCHTAGSNSAHLNLAVSYGSKLSAAPGNGSCTNTCHLSPEAGDWTGGAAAIGCTDCHSGSGASAYIGGDKSGVAGPNYMPQYAMHLTVPTVSGKVHTDTGLSTTCAFCHSTMGSYAATHPNGVWTADDADNTNDQNRGMFAAFIDGNPATCATSCHSAGTAWSYKWSASAGLTTGAECANCHGDYNSGWTIGVGHAVISARGNVGAHVDTGSLGYECTACHVIGATTNNYKWTTKWDPTGVTSNHGDGDINVNNTSATPTRSTNAGCQGCHTVPDGSHDFPISSWNLVALTGDAPAGASACNTCHHDGGAGTNPWPTDDGAFPYQGGGKHVEHVTAISLAKSIAQDATCVYCHLNPGGAGHDTNNAPAAADVTGIKNLITGVADTNASVSGQGTNLVNCSLVDCHFNNTVTPHWYTDLTPPDVRSLTVVQGPEPRSIKVSWLAPGDDAGVDNTTAYVYDMRYSVNDGGADATNFASTTNYVGGLPATYNRNFASSVVAKNLEPGDTYYFSLRTRDTAGNWSNGSAPSAGIVPTPDAQVPDFGGANKAVKGDEGASINVYWTSAEDHTMPITYKIWMVAAGAGSGTNGALKMGDGTGTDSPDAPLITGWLDSKIELENGKTYNGFGPITINNDTVYQIGIRACDALGNCDLNNQVVSATPTAVPLVAKTYHTYRTNGSLSLVKDGSAGTEVLGTTLGTGIVFAPAANNTFSVNYFVDTFAVYLDTGNGAATVQATVGYTTNGLAGTFVALGTPKAITLGSRADRVYQFKIVDVGGQNIGIGQRLSILLEETTAVGVKANYGSTAYRGDVTLAEQFVNAPPTAATNNGTTGIGVGDAIVNIKWNASVDGSDGIATDNTIHYDIYGSDDNGVTYDYVIAENYTGPTNLDWDTQTAGIISGTIAVKINAGDGYAHTSTIINNLGSADASDYVAPSPINDLIAKKRPKAGTVWLTWTAPGDDYHNHGRADHYDIRYDTRQIVESGGNGTTTIDFNSIPATGQVTGEPYPDFGGEIQHFEVTGLLPETNYYFAIKTYDENSNGSTISTAKGGGDTTQVGGPRCGMCHTTAPSVDESVGNHKLHGFTLNDCDKCHTPAADSGLADLSPPSSYGLDHQDGKLVMGYGSNGAYEGFISGERIYYTADGTPGGALLYDDTDGFGGFGDGTYTPVPGTTAPFEAIDSGTCINFGTRLGGACHGSAGTDPDGGGSLPTYETPTWNAAAVLNCAACHGNPSRTNDLYGVPFDATTANAGVVTDQIKGSPIVDNHGNYLDDGTGTEGQRMFIGQHEKHLNYSFRFSKGDSCNLCHPGKYTDKDNIDGRHANGEIEVELDLTAAGDNAVWTPGNTSNPDPAFWTAGTCGSMSPESCHPATASPKWDTAQSFDCVGCHNMGGVTPDHITDPAKNIDVDNDLDTGNQMLGNCTWCHFPGHPTDDLGGTAIILANSPQVGINYKSGGIHLRRVIGGRASAATEAQLCWGCHDQNSNGSLNDAGDISEWGSDGAGPNTATIPANATNYNYGTLNQLNWVGATWSSSEANFSYKTGLIRSTHSTNESGSSAVTGTAYNYTESPDSVDKIRCSNCHDVHNMNKAPGDNPDKLASLDAPPYLRGTWVRNPYLEDGAPWNKTYVITNALFTAVPRGGSASGNNNELGGYQIDQNNGSPTAGLSLATSAGICTLCHGTDVDAMDKTGSENLWMATGKNGHSNAALGGTASELQITNIFGNGVGGRAVPNASASDGSPSNADIYDMALQTLPNTLGATTVYGYGYRSDQTGTGKYTPVIASKQRAYNSYTWGATVDQTTLDVGYHAFTCSKCHNPHASRLPKLMITNCLDTGHNTWDNAQGKTQTFWTSTDDNGEWTATHNTAQNCHRYDPIDGVGGWNKVTPW